MAPRHAQYGARRAGGGPPAAVARAATAEIDMGAASSARSAEAEDAADAVSSPTTAEIQTNALSGPITVPQRVRLADSGIDTHPLALRASGFGAATGATEAEEVLDRFASLGGTLVDTADSYAGGRSERIVGEWMAARGTRDRMRIMTRVGRHPDHPGLSPASIAAAVDASLGRLGTERIDLLCFHGDDPDVPLEESLGAVDALIAAGKVRAIGASGSTPERLIEARVLAANGLPRFEVLATRYNLMERRGFEGAPELVAHAQGLAVLPDIALAEGFLAGRVRRRADLRRDPRGERQARHLGRRGLRVLRMLDEIAAAHGTVPAAVAIAWLLSRPTVVAPIAGASRPEQVDALMGAASLILHRSELVELDRASS
ncbi:aldo/keto reductase [Agromyces sp. ZXT2-6]|uniref:aldo/keto reductase n=1 Tax=Agromyces sp. ZXT2-6 TaxID=3461153 RepID=UPI00405504B7